jgi:D-beta-D-heptose 7-phosphate kinase/D-beta-D-heptose 1-phosphate adenosyltransferase
MKRVVIVTGGFDPIHSGHIAYIRSAREMGDYLVAGVNTDAWLKRKKGRAFLPWYERATIVEAIKGVDMILGFDDSDNSAKDCITQVRHAFPHAMIVFANGGDRTRKNIPEMDVADDNIEFHFGVGGEFKKNSSTWILDKWQVGTQP